MTTRKSCAIASKKKDTPIEKSKKGRKAMAKDKESSVLFTSYETVPEECKFLTKVVVLTTIPILF